MLFQFLRQYFHDDELERTRHELADTKQVLAEYKRFIDEQKKNIADEKKKVDLDFIGLLWASIGFAFIVFGESAQKVISFQPGINAQYIVWFAFTLFSIIFIIFNSINALELTRKYAKEKSDSIYLTYAYFVIAGAVILVMGVIGLAYFM